MSGEVFYRPLEPDAGWTYVGVTEADGLIYSDPAMTVQVNERAYTTRAWARVGPDGVLTLDAPLVEVDPQALATAFEQSIGSQERTDG